MNQLIYYLKHAAAECASDIFFVAGGPVSEKRDGHILPLEEERLLPPDTERLLRAIYEAAGRSIDRFLETGDDDFAFSIPGLSRFRVNAYRQRGSMAAVIRLVSFDIPDWRNDCETTWRWICNVREAAKGRLLHQGRNKT